VILHPLGCLPIPTDVDGHPPPKHTVTGSPSTRLPCMAKPLEAEIWSGVCKGMGTPTKVTFCRHLPVFLLQLQLFLLAETYPMISFSCSHIHSFIAFCSHTSCNWILEHEYKRSIKLIQYIHIKYTTIRDAPMG